MYKSSYQKQDKNILSSGKNLNFLSPPSNPKFRQNPFYNSNMPKMKPVNLYSKYLSPTQNDKNFSVKNVCSPDDKLNQDLLNKFSNYQKNESGKMVNSPTTNNSDALTMDTMTQRSNESFISNGQLNGNNLNYIPMPNNFTLCQYPNHRYNYSMTNYPQMNQMNYFYPQNTNTILNGNYNMNMKFCNNNIRQSATMIHKKNKMNPDNTTSKTTNNKFKKNYVKKNKNNSNYNNSNEEEKIDVSNFNSNNSIKSSSNSDKSEKSGKSNKSNNSNGRSKNSSNIMTSNDSMNGKSEKMLKNPNNTRGGNKHYNKFNPPKENNTINENTVILTVNLKVGPNDFRTFNLKKYDDLFISLEKFFDLNRIKQDLVKPIVTKIFDALNRTFWLLNNKIGIYDQEYLNSLYKLWKKNNEQIPKRNNSQEEETKSNGSGRNKKNKTNSDKSTISSSDSSDGDKKHKKIMSNSFQNLDNSTSEDGKEGTCNSV